MNDTRPHLVLLVEDEPDLAEMLCELLRDLGHEVCWEASLAGAEAAAARRPDVVITDLTLPDGDPVLVATRLRRRFPAAQLVLMSAIANVELQRLARQVGADGTIPKPFDVDAFQEIVTDAADRRPPAP